MVAALFDTGPILWLQSWASPALTAVMSLVSLLGYTAVYVMAVVALAFTGRLRAGTALLLLLALTAVLSDGAKLLGEQPRPDSVDPRVLRLDFQPIQTTEDTYGFPSGHVASATAFCLGLIWLAGWWRGWVALAVWVPLMALSRLYLGRHFVGDVLGGLALGLIAVALGRYLLDLHRLARRDAGPWPVGGTLGLAAGASVTAFATGIPSTGEAGLLVGFALGAAIAARAGPFAHADTEPVAARRVLLAFLLFGAVWGGTWLLVTAGGAPEAVALFAAQALAGCALVAGPLLIERRMRTWRIPRP